MSPRASIAWGQRPKAEEEKALPCRFNHELLQSVLALEGDVERFFDPGRLVTPGSQVPIHIG